MEGRYALSGNKLFGRNLKKIAQYREFKGASYDVNKTFGTEIFNTDPIVATAVALELAPQSFSLGGVFKNMIDTGVIKRVEGFNSNNFNNKAIDEVIDFYTKKKEVILRDTNINAYQQKELNEINEVLVKANEFKEVRKQMDSNVANEIPMEIISSYYAGALSGLFYSMAMEEFGVSNETMARYIYTLTTSKVFSMPSVIFDKKD